MGVQDVITLALVAWAAAYVVRLAFKSQDRCSRCQCSQETGKPTLPCCKRLG